MRTLDIIARLVDPAGAQYRSSPRKLAAYVAKLGGKIYYDKSMIAIVRGDDGAAVCDLDACAHASTRVDAVSLPVVETCAIGCDALADSPALSEAIEGSVFTLHYNERLGRWLMSSPRLCDAANVEWMGTTWGAALAACAGVKDLNALYDCLDKSKQYSVLMHYCAFHPFSASINDIANTLFCVGDEQITIDGRTIPRQERTAASADDSCESRIDAIRKRCEGALDDYLEHGNVFHGYIFRSASARAHLMFVESSLHKFIREQVYSVQVPPSIGARDREMYTHVCAYLDRERKQLHARVFANARPIFAKMDAIINVLSKSTLGAMRMRNPRGSGRSEGSELEREARSELEKVFDEKGAVADVLARITLIATSMAATLSAERMFSAFSENAMRNMMDVYLDKRNAGEYTAMMK